MCICLKKSRTPLLVSIAVFVGTKFKAYKKEGRVWHWSGVYQLCDGGWVLGSA